MSKVKSANGILYNGYHKMRILMKCRVSRASCTFANFGVQIAARFPFVVTTAQPVHCGSGVNEGRNV
jgi:hypothetical protein